MGVMRLLCPAGEYSSPEAKTALIRRTHGTPPPLGLRSTGRLSPQARLVFKFIITSLYLSRGAPGGCQRARVRGEKQGGKKVKETG